MRVGAGMLVLLATGCGSSGKPGASANAPRPAAIPICGKATSPAEALERGCPREAWTLLGNATGLESDILRLEARADALGHGFDRLSPWGTDVSPAADQPWLAPITEPLGTLEPFLVADGEDRIPAELRTSARLLRLLVRAAPDPMCLSTKRRRTDDILAFWAEAVDVWVKVYRKRDPTNPTVLRLANLAQLRVAPDAPRTYAACRTSPELFDEAARALAAAGRADDAIEARLDAIELVEFPGGRALELDLAFGLTNFETAALEEAARLHTGRLFEAGTRVETKLAAMTPRSDAVTARVQIVRAIAALRLRQDPVAARTLATTASTTAERALRADLRDQARVVLLLCDLTEEHWPDFDARLAELDASFEARGALGARRALATKLGGFVDIDRVSARGRRAIDLAKRLVRLAPSLPAHKAIEVMLVLPWALMSAGSMDEAVEAVRELDAAFQRRKSELTATAVQGYARRIQLFQDLVATQDPDYLGPDPDHIEYKRAFRSGDVDTLLAIRNRSTPNPVARDLRLARANTGCRLVGGARLREIAEGLAHEMETFDLDDDTRREIGDQALQHSVVFGGCAAKLQDPELARLATRLARAEWTPAEGGVPSEMAHFLEAAELEASRRFAGASRLYLDTARAVIRMRGLSGEGAVNVGEEAGVFFGRAAASAIKGNDLATAVAIFEESRARDLRAARQVSGAKATEAIAKLERELGELGGRLRALANLEGRAPADSRAKLATERDRVEKRIAELERALDAAAREVQRRDPRAYQQAALAATPTLGDIAKRLAPDETLIYSVLGDDEAWLIVVDPSGAARAVELDVAVAHATRRYIHLLGEQIAAGRGLVRKQRDPATAEPVERARLRLGALLARPLEAAVPAGRRLVIVPDAITASLPWAAIEGSAGPLILRHPIRILPGAYMLPATRTPARAPRTALIVGDVEFGSEASVPRTRGAAGGVWENLPGTKAEASFVASIYGTRVLSRRDATEAAVRGKLGTVDLVHLATHGLAEVARPRYSTVVLALPKSGERDDGLLHAHEVERLAVRAELVVLSACETGMGRVFGVEGAFGLDRAFLVAGAGATVSSLWVVNDDATAKLMQHFHQRIRAGASADVALASAMATVRADPRWRDPYFWAAFRVVGAGLR